MYASCYSITFIIVLFTILSLTFFFVSFISPLGNATPFVATGSFFCRAHQQNCNTRHILTPFSYWSLRGYGCCIAVLWSTLLGGL